MKRCTGDRGALIVEAAFVFPIFLTLLFGIIDIGYAEFQTSQATAAARDGARTAILNYATADVSGSSDYQKIATQVNARITGQIATISVSCLSGLTGTATKTCSAAVADQDRIQVSVSWPYTALTPVMATLGAKTISGTATMAILGAPSTLAATTTTTTTATTLPGSTTTSSTTTSTVPGSCGVVSLTADPDFPINKKNNSTDLQHDTTFTVTTNGAATCSGLKIQLPTMSSPTTLSLTFGGGSTWSINIGSSQLQWAAGTNLALNIQSSGGTTLSGGSFLVTVQ